MSIVDEVLQRCFFHMNDHGCFLGNILHCAIQIHLAVAKALNSREQLCIARTMEWLSLLSHNL